jgi:uncharacterized protein (TIRG00374 family)
VHSSGGDTGVTPFDSATSVTPNRRRRNASRTLLVILGLFVSALFAYVALRNAHYRQTVDALRETNVPLLIPALGALVLAFLLRAVRWRSLFSRSSRPAFRDVVPALFVGYVANALLPVRAGEAAAVVALNRRSRTPVAEGAATMIIQRAEDVLSLVLLLFVMLPWLPPVSWLRAAGLVAIFVMVLLAAVAVVFLRYGERPLRFLLRPLQRFNAIPKDSLEDAPAYFNRGLVALVSPRVAIVSFAWTTLSWIVLATGFWLVMVACGIELSLLAAELVVIGIGLAMVLPSSPAALGVFEGATVVVLSAYAIPASEALSYALVLHALNVVPLLVVAAVAVLLRRRSVLGQRRVAVQELTPKS